jgi:hypothetical protein
VHACPRQWSNWLDLAEFWYNTSLHSALGRSPFEVLYGFAPRQFGLHSATDPPIKDLTDWLHDRELMTEVIKQHLHRAKNRMKKHADEHRSERVFRSDDWVFLKLQPYVQSSLADRSHQKLAFCNILAQGLTGLIGYSYQQVATSFPEAHLERTPKLSVLGLERWVTDPEVLSGCARVRTKCAEKTCVGL